MADDASLQSLVEGKFHMGQRFFIDDLKHLVDGPPESLVLLPSAQGFRHRVHVADELSVVRGHDGIADTAQRAEEVGLGRVQRTTNDTNQAADGAEQDQVNQGGRAFERRIGGGRK
jgi:hypothetical protein